jgi:uncharacterized protein with PIN domain
MRLLCDRMLGTLARWLRFMGHDVHYPTTDVEDEELIGIALDESRTLVTRDRALAQKVKGSILITSTELEEQLRQVLAVIGEPESGALTRCGVCNSLLEHVEKSKVKGIVPDPVFERQEEFMRCPICDKIYWHGSHFDRIMKRIEGRKKDSGQT